NTDFGVTLMSDARLSYTPLSDAQVNARLAEFGMSLKRAPGNEEWPDGWYPGDAPLDIRLDAARGGTADCRTDGAADDDGDDRTHPLTKFGTAERVRFLDALAGHGNVRKAAARVGISRETAYRARRRYGDFAQLWEAALVHARAASEAELADLALEGVPVPVFVRGEHVATWHRKDAQLLLAHLGRLDRRVDMDKDVAMRAENFDRLLAEMAGHKRPEDFADATKATCPDAVPSRREYTMYRRDVALDAAYDACKVGDAKPDMATLEETEARFMADYARDAEAIWDRWDTEGAAVVDRVLDGHPREAQNSVACVNNRAARRRAMKAERKKGRKKGAPSSKLH
ncbi:MAG: helix-turn-helix domain-containing protein, partial [Pontixanthobacter sp.]